MAVKKENVQFNETTETLFVGVGGIGSDIVKKVAERCRGTEIDKIKFVVMDTNVNDLNNVKQSDADITYVQTSSTQTVLDYLKNDADASNNWFPNNTTLYSKTVSEGAGQVRAISRLALNATIKNGNIQALYKAIDDLFLKDGGDLKQALRVVIVSSAAGGTGSGIAMPVGMLIREYLHKHYREKAPIIRGYLLLPGVLDSVIGTETERESLRRNGYATIKEVNAFMMKASGFCGVRKDLERYKDLYIDVPTTTNGVDKLEGLPFDFCFLLDKVGESQESMQTLEQYKEFAAQSLYEQNVGPMQKNAFSIEDNIIKEFANGDNLGRNRFGGLGASVIKYPYEDIIEYVAYSRAISCIGDGNEVGAWLKYDKAFEQEKAEFKKRRAVTADAAPEISKVYIDKVNEGNQRFDKDIKGIIANDIEKFKAEVNIKLMNFLNAFDGYIQSSFESDPNVRGRKEKAIKLSTRIDYENYENPGENVNTNLKTVRGYETDIKKNAAIVARSAARSVLFDSPSINADKMPYNIESLLIGTDGGAMHPNAMRYMLYALKQKVEEIYKNSRAELNDNLKKLNLYSSSANDEKYFDVTGGFTSKNIEKNLDDVCKLASDNDAKFFDKIGGYKALWDKLNKLFPAYVKVVNKYCDNVLKESAYAVANDYLGKLCTEFENFYSSFEGKVYLLSNKQNDIVSKLKFKDGNTTAYVCADRDCLDRITKICPTAGNDLMLPSELSAKIFDAVKVNAENARIAENDPALAKPRTDIFDTVLIDYFKDSVREDCDEVINIDIISAIKQECAFKEYFKAVANADYGEVVYTPELTDAKKDEYCRSIIKFANQLASPGIGCANFDEPRLVKLCAYNSKLLDLRDCDVNTLVAPFKMGTTATNTVSKYEMHFFNALYNITPDKLSRFKGPDTCGADAQYNEEPGIYFKSYHDYIKKLGPDSTKSAAISLHIDKRWDSLTEMPEISLGVNYDEMVKIHSALIYGVVHGMIITHPSSRYDAKKRIYALEDTEGDRTALIVSNNTECDEFYEVLDALYRDRASVAKIYEMQAERCEYDINSNHRYTETAFVKDTETFRIGDGHVAPTSVFEIPLAYYNSLPRSKMDDNELAIMIDSVIAVMETEISKYEQEVDRAPILARRLEEQFKLFIDNFKNDAFNENDAMRKNTEIADNRVVNMVYRKVSNKIKKLNTFEASKKVEELHNLIK